TYAQGARRMGVKPSTLKQYVARCKRKLGTTSLRETIAEAVRYYVILGFGLVLASGAGEVFYMPWDSIQQLVTLGRTRAPDIPCSWQQARCGTARLIPPRRERKEAPTMRPLLAQRIPVFRFDRWCELDGRLVDKPMHHHSCTVRKFFLTSNRMVVTRLFSRHAFQA